MEPDIPPLNLPGPGGINLLSTTCKPKENNQPKLTHKPTINEETTEKTRIISVEEPETDAE